MRQRVTVERHQGDTDRHMILPLRDSGGDPSNPAASFTGSAPHVFAEDGTEITTAWEGAAYTRSSSVWRKLRVPLANLAAGEHPLSRVSIAGDNDVDLRHVLVRIN